MPRRNTQMNKNHVTVPNSNIVVKNNTSLFSSIKEGFGFGIGSTIARNLFSVSNESSNVKPNCVEYKKCLESNDKYECFSNLNQNEYNECKLTQ